VRLLIGVFEAGFFPTVCFYLSTFYTRFDLGLRLALFYGNYAVAGAFSGALGMQTPSCANRSLAYDLNPAAYGIFQIKGVLKGWQYLFIIEGTLTCLVGIIAWFWMPSGPGSAWVLSRPQQNFVIMRVQRDNEKYIRHDLGKDGIELTSDRLSKRDFVETAKDWKLWYALLCNICASVPPTAFSVFLPLV
jgi:hypothetical protein